MTGQNLLIQTWPFSDLPAEELAAVRDCLRDRSLEEGEFLFRQGEPAGALYLIAEGRCEVLSGREGTPLLQLAQLETGDLVGEMALALAAIGGRAGARSASVRALSDCRLFELRIDDIQALFARQPRLGKLLGRLAGERLSGLEEHFEALFGELDPQTLARLQASLERVPLLAGQILFRQGDPADGIFIVETGCVEVVVEQAGGEQTVAELRRGQIVGEAALLTQESRSATIRAARDSSLFRLSNESFESIVLEHPKATLKLARTLARRLVRTTHRVTTSESAMVVCLLAADDGALDGFGSAVASQLRGSSGLIDSSRFECAGSLDLADLERRHEVLLLSAGPEMTPWAHFCVRQSDRVVLVARASGSPALTAVEQMLKRGEVRGRAGVDRLVLLHPAGTKRAVGTASWLEERPDVRHHHVDETSASDVARVARHLTGHAVGLVLSGGGSRCFAHVGLLHALGELGLSIDAIGGTSSGAQVAGSFAANLGMGNVERLMRLALLRRNPLGALTVPMVALRDSRKSAHVAEEICEGVHIEDLWIPFYCVSTNLTRMQPRLHTRGELARALMASGSLPVMMPPIPEHGDVLCDGGLLDNLPVAPMRALGVGKVLASDVSSSSSKIAVDPALEYCPGGFSLLARKLNPFRPQHAVPNILGMAYQSILCAAVMQQRIPGNEPDLLLRPDLEPFEVTDFGRHEEMVEIGRRLGLANSEELQALWDVSSTRSP